MGGEWRRDTVKRFIRILIDSKTPPATAALYEQVGSQLQTVKSATGPIDEVIHQAKMWCVEGELRK